MNIDITIIKDIPIKQIDRFTDLVVKGAARATLDMTAGNFPRLTGDLERGSNAFDVKGSNKVYGIGSTVDYAKYVWKMNNVHWTNPNTIAQWYYWVFRVKQEQIINQAITGAKNLL